jgi:hypothetical protein
MVLETTSEPPVAAPGSFSVILRGTQQQPGGLDRSTSDHDMPGQYPSLPPIDRFHHDRLDVICRLIKNEIGDDCVKQQLQVRARREVLPKQSRQVSSRRDRVSNDLDGVIKHRSGEAGLLPDIPVATDSGLDPEEIGRTVIIGREVLERQWPSAVLDPLPVREIDGGVRHQRTTPDNTVSAEYANAG